VTRDDPGEHVAQVSLRMAPSFILQVSMSEAMTAQCSPPPSEPGKSFAPERDRPDCALDDIVVNLDAAVVEGKP
jgi:hypothetical protein